MKERRELTRWLLLAAVIIPIALVAQNGAVITPADAYSDPAWRDKAAAANPGLARLQSSCAGKFAPDTFRFLAMGETSVGGLGLWPNPVNFGATTRYLGVFCRLQVPPPSTGRGFPDTESGRILTIFDAFGKDTIAMMSKELAGMSDPQIAGGAIIFIYGKRPINDPAFESDAEALALFIPRPTLTAFAELRMTVQTLFSQSEMLPIFRGGDQINNLRLYILQP